MVAAAGRSAVRRVDPTASLAAVCPAVAAQWHPARNPAGRIGPHSVSARAALIVWWRCPAGHEWEESVAARTDLAPVWKNGDPAACRRCQRPQRRTQRR